MVYRAGKFISADLDQGERRQQRNAFIIMTGPRPHRVVQIAGLVAGRIVALRAGRPGGRGRRRIGMIRLLPVDVYLPEGAGRWWREARAIAGETVLADLGQNRRRAAAIGLVNGPIAAWRRDRSSAILRHDILALRSRPSGDPAPALSRRFGPHPDS